MIDHSVQVDVFGNTGAFAKNAELEFERNQERYLFLRWGQQAFNNFRVVPPDTGIVHQVNLEYLAPVVFASAAGEAYPDTVLGTDSHTTMINGLGVVGWGVGGIEAEAAMLGPVGADADPGSGRHAAVGRAGARRDRDRPGAHGHADAAGQGRGGQVRRVLRAGPPHADDRRPRHAGQHVARVRGHHWILPGRRPNAGLPASDRPRRPPGETGRGILQGAGAVPYGRLAGAGFQRHAGARSVHGRAEPGRSAPSAGSGGLGQRARDYRTQLVKEIVEHIKGVDPKTIGRWSAEGGNADNGAANEISDSELGHLADTAKVQTESGSVEIGHGSVLIAAITSCTNTSNPSVMLGAGILAKKAVERGLRSKPWVKTSLAPGSKVVTRYLDRAGLTPYLEQLGFHLVGYGCTTCIGNSGPVPEALAAAIKQNNLVAAAVLSGNRNFEGRINPVVRFNYLASPPLVVAYALAGTIDTDLA